MVSIDMILGSCLQILLATKKIFINHRIVLIRSYDVYFVGDPDGIFVQHQVIIVLRLTFVLAELLKNVR